MRHIPERLFQPLSRILNECEAKLRGKAKRTLADETELYWLCQIKTSLSKKYDYQLRNTNGSSQRERT